MLSKFKVHLYLFLVLILSVGTTIAQSSKEPTKIVYNYNQGYRFIEKAKTYLEDGEYKKAEKFLRKAKRSDFGFCGNSWMVAHKEIDRLTVELYLKEGRFEELLSFLETIESYGFGQVKRDNLKITALINIYGKDAVKTAIDNAAEFMAVVEYNFDFDYTIHLSELNYALNFKDSRDESQIDNDEENSQDIIESQEFYKQLM